MASTSTNKQPLLIDRPLHVLENLDNKTTGTAATVLNGDIGATNNAVKIVDCTQNDGAIIECIYSLSRGQNGSNEWIINLYLSNENDFLRPTAALFLGSFEASGTTGGRTEFLTMPETLAPVPYQNEHTAAAGNPKGLQFRALYVPKGKCFWAAVNHNGTGMTTGPILGAQGGFY